MCLIAFAINACASRPFVLASNRDEFLDRPTLPLARWKTASGQEIISGRDTREGGTWLGVTPSGRVAFLTNVREPKRNGILLSRGQVVIQWLEGSSTAKDFFTALEMSKEPYNGFNLVLGDLGQSAWTWLTNMSTATSSGWQAQALPAGVYGLSNAALDTPWPKTVELKLALATALIQTEKSNVHEQLFSALASQAQSPPAEKWQAVDSQDAKANVIVGMELESGLASAFVDIPEKAYGTRSSTVVVFSKQTSLPSIRPYQVELWERTYTRERSDQPNASFFTTFLSL